MIHIFSKVAYWGIKYKEAIVYCQYDRKPGQITVTSTVSIEFETIFCAELPNFCLKIRGDLATDTVYLINGIQTYLEFPFDTDALTNTSTVISTMCKDYAHRLDEWIRYHLKLGFTAIIIFNNDGNKSNPINESWTLRSDKPSVETIEQIAQKYCGKVLLVDFPYSPFPNELYDTIQWISLTVAANVFRTRCRHICLTDADEFIYIPSQGIDISIEVFLAKYPMSMAIQSNILTNRGNMDVINNNVIKLATYLGENKYQKLIMRAEDLEQDEFILSPHKHPKAVLMPKEIIIHYHCWLNTRYDYKRAMQKVLVLQQFMESAFQK